MKKLYLLTLMAVSSLAMDAKNLAINNQEYEVDTITAYYQIGPGLRYAHYHVPARPLHIHVMEMDVTNPYLKMEVWNGGQAAVACETPTSVYNRYDRTVGQAVAAHNGDFFTTNLGEAGISRMGLIGAGDIIFNPTGNPLFILDEKNRPFIDYVNFGGTVTAGGASTRLHTVNQLRLEWEPGTHADQLSLYTPAFGAAMHANSIGGTVAVLAPVAGSAAFPNNRPIEMKVVECVANPGQIAIPEDGAVLHGIGSSATFLNGLAVGRTLTLNLTTTTPSYPELKNITEAIGGSGHIILRNGQITNINNPDCHPRTFMGISQDQKTVWSVVVDGRWGASAGIDLDDQGRVLQWLGAWDGINLDGGGSSCMVVNSEIVNHPSDGPERAVGNGVVFYATSPEDNVFNTTAFEPGDYLHIPVGTLMKPNIYAYNKYGVLVNKKVPLFQLSTSDPIGKIWSDNKIITMSSTPAKGVLNAFEWNYQTSCSVPIEVVFAKAKSKVPNYVVTQYDWMSMSLYSTVGAKTYRIDPKSIEWEISDPDVAHLTSDGRIAAGGKNGTALLIGKSPHFTDTLTVTAESFDTYINGDLVHDVLYGVPLDKLSLKQSGGTGLTATEAQRGFNLTYTGNGTARGCYIQLADSTGKITTRGTPDAIILAINPGDAPITQISMNYTDNLGNRGTLNFEKIPGESDSETIEPNKENRMRVNLNDVRFANEDECVFPITFAGLRFSMGTSKKAQEYKIEIPNFYYIYTFRASVDDVTADQPRGQVPEGTYDLQGRRVEDAPATPGLYIKNGEKILVK